MSFVALYAENASIIGTYTERRDAVDDAVSIAMRRPDLSTDVGIAEIDDETGLATQPFVSASDLLAADDPDAVAAADAHDFTTDASPRVTFENEEAQAPIAREPRVPGATARVDFGPIRVLRYRSRASLTNNIVSGILDRWANRVGEETRTTRITEEPDGRIHIDVEPTRRGSDA